MKKKPAEVNLIRYRDKSGRFAKFDGRKSLRKETVFNDGRRELTKAIRGLANWDRLEQKEPISIRERIAAKVKGLAPQTVEKLSNYSSPIEIVKDNNKDLYTVLANKKINQVAKGLKKKGYNQVALLRIQVGDRTLEKVIKVSDFKKKFEYGKRAGKPYTIKDVIATFAHQMLNDIGVTPYEKGFSDGNKEKRTRANKAGKKRYYPKQTYQIAFRNIKKGREVNARTLEQLFEFRKANTNKFD